MKLMNPMPSSPSRFSSGTSTSSKISSRVSDDARTGVVELSSALGISRNTVQSRVRRLEESGVLTGYQPRVDLAEAGLAVQAFVALEINQVVMSSVVSGLARIPQVLEVHATTGREDLLVRVATATQAELQELVVHILAIPGVEERTEMSVNAVAAKYVHDEISQMVYSKRIVCGGRYLKRCQLYSANVFCL